MARLGLAAEPPDSQTGRRASFLLRTFAGCIMDVSFQAHSEPIVRPAHIYNPDMPGPRFCCFLTVDEVEQLTDVGGITLTPARAQAVQAAIARFMKCLGGKHFPTPSEMRRRLTSISKTFGKAADAIEGVGLSRLVGVDCFYERSGHVNRNTLHQDLAQIAPTFKRNKSVENAASILANLRAVAAPWSDTDNIEVRIDLDIIRLIESHERRSPERLGPGIPAALRRLASCARDASEATDARGLTGEWPRLILIRELYAIYRESGGRSRLTYSPGKGRLTYNSASGQYSGEFFKLISSTLRLIGISQTNQQLGNAITKAFGS